MRPVIIICLILLGWTVGFCTGMSAPKPLASHTDMKLEPLRSHP